MIMQYGEINFLNKCNSSGVNGLIIVDLLGQKIRFSQKNVKKNLSILFAFITNNNETET